MLKKTFENIDNRASIPIGIVFRKDQYWDRIEKTPRKNPTSILVWIAACFALLLLGGTWYLLEYRDAPAQYVLSNIPKTSQEILLLEKYERNSTKDIQPLDAEVKEPTYQISLPPIDSLVEGNNEGEDPVSKPTRAFVFPPFEADESDQKALEEVQLSPSASALKNALANTKKEKPKEERLVVEKLTFEQMIQARKNYFIEKSEQKKSGKSND